MLVIPYSTSPETQPLTTCLHVTRTLRSSVTPAALRPCAPSLPLLASTLAFEGAAADLLPLFKIMRTLFLLICFLVPLTLCDALVIDDFSETTLSAPLMHSSAMGNTASGTDSAPGTLFDQRYFSIDLLEPTQNGETITAQITGGAFHISTTQGATGRALLYHDSVFHGPFLDLSSFFTEAFAEIDFATSPNQNVGFTLALESQTGRLLFRGDIPAATEVFSLRLSEVAADETFDPATIYETRWFFRLSEPGTSFAINSIQIVPEPSIVSLLFFGVLLIVMRRRS
jgi:hypothetical protein